MLHGRWAGENVTDGPVSWFVSSHNGHLVYETPTLIIAGVGASILLYRLCTWNVQDGHGETQVAPPLAALSTVAAENPVHVGHKGS